VFQKIKNIPFSQELGEETQMTLQPVLGNQVISDILMVCQLFMLEVLIKIPEMEILIILPIV
jgi:hypothetical protein